MTGSVLYVYYKVRAEQHAHWAPKVRQFQSALPMQWPGLQAELLQRPEAANGIETWMETYRCDGGLTPALIEHIAKAASEAGLPAPRHVETFIPLR